MARPQSTRASVLVRNCVEAANFIRSFMNPEYSYGYWHCDHPLSSDIARGAYPIDFRAKLNYHGPRDQDGIPLLDLGTVPTADDLYIVESPILVAQWGLGWHARHIAEQTPATAAELIRAADWLEQRRVRATISGRQVSICHMDSGKGRALSGMAQGQAMSLWTRAFYVTGDLKYLFAAAEAFELLTIDVSEGGVLTSSGGVPVIEEWSTDPIRPLNGHLFAFIGILDLEAALRTCDRFSDQALLQRVNAASDLHRRHLVSLVRASDTGCWSLYALESGGLPNFASCFYHRLHIALLQGLAEIMDEAPLGAYAARWSCFLQRPHYRLLAMCMKLAHTAGRQIVRLTTTVRPIRNEAGT